MDCRLRRDRCRMPERAARGAPLAPQLESIEEDRISGGGEMERIWLKSYPPGVPGDIADTPFNSVGELVDRKTVEYRDRGAFHRMGKTITFGDLDRMSRGFGAWLQSMGCGKGARVALMMPNCLQYPVALYGTLRAGCVVVNV